MAGAERVSDESRSAATHSSIGLTAANRPRGTPASPAFRIGAAVACPSHTTESPLCRRVIRCVPEHTWKAQGDTDVSAAPVIHREDDDVTELRRSQ
ncbi:hypothetical protein EYF80_007087 [Liparis tanakae]|uniref:Uncharacterized protein n=1 Tax=Liparis tanakae TaxID=230148 RepID=A0A4Z2IX53_9TELE|nr:hypothetical protein EYF80_007087 [Liparis tanakae]